jgi:hypothetical protein
MILAKGQSNMRMQSRGEKIEGKQRKKIEYGLLVEQ